MSLDKKIIKYIIGLRVAIGHLGERSVPRWWNSAFFDNAGKTFLAPVFPKTYVHAQYHGVVAAAALVHDEYIGVGNVFHLFRLPEIIEQDVHAPFDADIIDEILNLAKDDDSSMSFLSKFGSSEIQIASGPLNIGRVAFSHDVSIWKQISSLYFEAFNQNIRTFPFFSDKQ